MSDPALGLLMLGLIVIAIMMGFPTAFTLMGLGVFFGFYAFYVPGEYWFDNRVFDLMVQRTYGAMTNDVLIAIPLFVLMGYVMERGALVDKMFYAVQLVFRRIPASLAVTTLVVCAFWGMATGLVGAVVVLMGVVALQPMLRAGYDVKLAAGVITAGGTLGILIPPSIMIIVYAAVAGQSVVKLYAAAMFPGLFLAFLYVLYVIGRAVMNPAIAPPLTEEETRIPVPDWMRRFQEAYSPNMASGLVRSLLSPSKAVAIETENGPLTYRQLLANTAVMLVPFVLTSGILGLLWWYIVIHPQTGAESAVQGIEQLGAPVADSADPEADAGVATSFYITFAVMAVVAAAMIVRYYWRMSAERLQVVKLLSSSVMPMALLIVLVLGAILLGITTATESAAIGAAGVASANAELEAHQGSGVSDRQDHIDGVLAVRRLGAVLGGVRPSRRSESDRTVGAVDEPDAGSVHDPVAGDHLHSRLAAGMDRDHHHLRADLPTAAEALRHRSGPVGRAGVRQSAGGVPVAAGRHVRLLFARRRAGTRHPEQDFCRHDAVHADCHYLHDPDVSVAGHDLVAAELSLWKLTQKRDRPGQVSGRSAAGITWIPGRSAVNCGHERL